MLHGHQDKISLFKRLVKSGNLGHAYLFYGDSQIGKRFFAHHLAHLLECGEFKICSGTLIDVIFIEPDEKGKIGIETSRDLKRFLYQKPLRSPKRLSIINEADKLTPEAQASLLKLVEDSPPSTTIIFIAPDPQALLPPLASRLMRIYFSRFPKTELEKILVSSFEISEKDAKHLARISFGRLGRALELKDGKSLNDDSLEQYVSSKITDIYLKNKKNYSHLLSWLLKRESVIRRFNLNPRLQRKVVEAKIEQVNY